MLATPVLDVAIGLSLFYLLLGLICTTVNEMIAGWTKSRANFLDKGIGRLLGDNPELKKLLYEHPLIQSLSQNAKSAAQTCPSYIPASTFATALLDIVSGKDKSHTDVGAVRDGAKNIGSEAFQITMKALIDASHDDPAKLRTNVEAWFDGGMDRVSGWYKRNSQRNALMLACLITLAVNADTVNAVHILWTNPVARAEAVSIGDKKVKDSTANAATTTPTSPEDGLTVEQKNLLGELTGWEKDRQKLNPPSGGIKWDALPGIIRDHLLGWILTALAVSLGAPFWFDTLNRFMNIRSAGRAPDERRDKSSAPPPTTPGPPPPQLAAPPVTPVVPVVPVAAPTPPLEAPPVTPVVPVVPVVTPTPEAGKA